MKSVSDYLTSINEEGEAAVNTVGDGTGAIKTYEKPLSRMYKRKGLDAQGNALELKNESGVTGEDATPEEKHKFKQKQQHQNDQVSNL